MAIAELVSKEYCLDREDEKLVRELLSFEDKSECFILFINKFRNLEVLRKNFGSESFEFFLVWSKKVSYTK